MTRWSRYSNRGNTFRKDLPALGALDRVNAMATLIGFPCYSLGILCGFFGPASAGEAL